MRRVLTVLMGAAAFCGTALLEPALADPALTSAPAAMRAAPSSQARVVQQVPANAQIDVNGCQGGWCYASWRDLFGYLPVRSVEAQPYGAAAPPPPPPAYGGPAVVVAPVVGWGWGWGPGWRHRW